MFRCSTCGFSVDKFREKLDYPKEEAKAKDQQMTEKDQLQSDIGQDQIFNGQLDGQENQQNPNRL